jgi:hypothetical protein
MVVLQESERKKLTDIGLGQFLLRTGLVFPDIDWLVFSGYWFD